MSGATTTWTRAVLCGAALVVGIAGCGQSHRALKVGTKGFAEQEVLAEMLAELARASGWTDVTVVTCDDTYGCHRALRTGKVDLMVEYSGTGLTFLGHQPLRGAASLSMARELFEPLGVRWLGALGFDNSYRLLMPAQRAAAHNIATIADLSSIHRAEGLRVACPAEYLRRPLDGLASMARRHGLRLSGQPLVIEEPQQRFQALFDGRADVAVGYGTDGAIDRLGLRALEDSLGFFPSYQAAVIVRARLLKKSKGLARVLAQIEGKLTEKVMRQLNYQVQVEGQKPSQVARNFLRRQKLLSSKTAAKARTAALVMALDSDDTLRWETTRAVGAARRVFSGYTVTTRAVKDVAVELADGKARLALVGAERFFVPGRKPPPRREARMQAVAVVGTRVLHLIRRADDGSTSHLSGKIGIQPEGSGGGIVAGLLLSTWDKKPARRADMATLLEALAGGSLDGVLVLARSGHPTVAGALSAGKLKLVDLTADTGAKVVRSPETSLSLRLPYLRSARVPAGTYRFQPEVVETLGSQVLLAGPAAVTQPAAGSGGPAAALPGGGRPLTRQQVLKLAQATGVPEAPDPALPSAWNLRADNAGPEPKGDTVGAVVETLLNIGVVLFLVWLAILLFAPEATATRDA